MKKILFVIYSYSLGGGAEKVLSNVVMNLDPGKYDITIQPYADYGVKEEETPSHVRVCKGIVDMTKAGRLEKGLKYFLVHFLPGILRKRYIRDQYDLEISFNYQIPSFLVRKTPETGVIEWNHGDVYDLKNKKIKRMLQKRSYRKADRIVTISENTKQSICELFPEFKDRIELIYNGIDVGRIERLAQQEAPAALREHSIVFIGRLEEAKRPLLLLEVIRRMHQNDRKISLYYLGQGEQKEELLEKIKEWGLEEYVFLLGYQKNPYSLIRQSKAICMMSRSEGFPTVFMEGLALGIPFVSSPVGGVKELSNGGRCGVIVNDVEECQEAITNIVFDEDTNRRMREACRRHIKNYTMEKQKEKIEDLFDRL